VLTLKQKWPEDVYFNGITVILQDRNWFTTPHIADVKFFIKKSFKLIFYASFWNKSTLLIEKWLQWIWKGKKEGDEQNR